MNANGFLTDILPVVEQRRLASDATSGKLKSMERLAGSLTRQVQRLQSQLQKMTRNRDRLKACNQFLKTDVGRMSRTIARKNSQIDALVLLRDGITWLETDRVLGRRVHITSLVKHARKRIKARGIPADSHAPAAPVAVCSL